MKKIITVLMSILLLIPVLLIKTPVRAASGLVATYEGDPVEKTYRDDKNAKIRYQEYNIDKSKIHVTYDDVELDSSDYTITPNYSAGEPYGDGYTTFKELESYTISYNTSSITMDFKNKYTVNPTGKYSFYSEHIWEYAFEGKTTAPVGTKFSDLVTDTVFTFRTHSAEAEEASVVENSLSAKDIPVSNPAPNHGPVAEGNAIYTCKKSGAEKRTRDGWFDRYEGPANAWLTIKDKPYSADEQEAFIEKYGEDAFAKLPDTEIKAGTNTFYIFYAITVSDALEAEGTAENKSCVISKKKTAPDEWHITFSMPFTVTGTSGASFSSGSSSVSTPVEKISGKSSVSKDVFSQAKAAGKDVEITAPAGNVTWDFKAADLKNENMKDFTPLVSIGKLGTVNSINKNLEKRIKDAGLSTTNITEVSFDYDGVLPGTALVTLDLSGMGYANGTVLYMYYFNPVTGRFQLNGKAAIKNDKAAFIMTHCSDYVVSDKELPAAMVEAATTATVSSPKTGVDNSMYFYLVLALGMAVTVLCASKRNA